MKILLITTSFPRSDRDPTGFFVYQLAQAISKQGIRLHVLTPQGKFKGSGEKDIFEITRFPYAPENRQELAQLPGGIPVALKSNPINYLLLPSFFFSFLWQILKARKDVDIILANWSICGVLAVLLRQLHGAPVITVLRGSDVKAKEPSLFNNLSHMILKKAVNESNAIVCVSQNMVRGVKKLSLLPRKIMHIPNGIHEAFLNLDLPKVEGAINFLFIGFFIPRKGIDILLAAYQKICQENCYLYLVGVGPLENELKRRADTFGITPSVSFMGSAPPGEAIAKIMGMAHVLVLPSHHEGRANVILEAMASGRPVIASDIPGNRELVTHGQTGYLFKDYDVDGLARSLKQMIDTPGKISKMGAAGKRWVLEQNLTWNYTAKNYLNLFSDLLKAD